MVTRRSFMSLLPLAPFAQSHSGAVVPDDRISRLEARLAKLEQERAFKKFVKALRRAAKAVFNQ